MSEQLKRFTYNPEDGSLIRTEQYKNLKEIQLSIIFYHTLRTILDEKYKSKRNIQAYISQIIKVYKLKTNPLII